MVRKAPLEADHEALLVAGVAYLGGVALKGGGLRGIFDRLVFLPQGIAALVEVKRASGRWAVAQQFRTAEFLKRKHEVYLLWNEKQVREWLEMMAMRLGKTMTGFVYPAHRLRSGKSASPQVTPRA